MTHFFTHGLSIRLVSKRPIGGQKKAAVALGRETGLTSSLGEVKKQATGLLIPRFSNHVKKKFQDV